MNKFNLNVSFEFPFLKLYTLISYSKVTKPTGLSYMLLVLIRESKDKDLFLSDVLENFGVPKNLHHIFVHTIQELIKLKILVTDKKLNNKNFSSFKIKDIEFTTKGLKIFSEEVIPTEQMKEEKIEIFYNISLKNFCFNVDKNIECKPLINSVLTKKFFEQFDCIYEDDIENFINTNKGTKNVKIKVEEIISNFELKKKESFVGKYNSKMIIYKNQISFEFNNKKIQDFFDNYYSSKIITKSINSNMKFKFNYNQNILKISAFEKFGIEDILLPGDIESLLITNLNLIISKEEYKDKNIFNIVSPEGIEIFNNFCEFIIVDNKNKIFALVPGIFEFKTNKNEVLNIPLILKLNVPLEKIQNVFLPYMQNISSFSEDNIRILDKIITISKDTKKGHEILNGYFSNDIEKNLFLLRKIKLIPLKTLELKQKYEELVNNNFEKYLENITEDKIENAIMIYKDLQINLDNPLEKFFKNIKSIKHPVKTYELLIRNEFDKKLVALYVNPVPEVLSKKNYSEKSLLNLFNFDSCISKLKKIAEISNIENYNFSELTNIDKEEFKKIFKNAQSFYKEVTFFETKNANLFKEYNNYMILFEKINDEINISESAVKNIKNINKKLIDKKISNGEYQFVLVNLSMKLEKILIEKYNLNGKLITMLDNAKDKKIINYETYDDLVNFKNNRNFVVHNTDKSTNYNIDDLKRWSKIVFDLEAEKNE